jgi:sterol desaturase/sphingolipid hydroxylase (fatty acid hydroxylase superfamily)
VEVDASTGLRIHPVEFLFQTASQAIVLPLLGVSLGSFVIYVVFLLPLAIINHANVKFPDWYEKYAGILFVTPNFHRVHHSSHQPETDSNYAEVFSIWDRLFKTHTTKNPHEITYGLDRLREKEAQTFWGMIVTPLRGVK